MTSPTASCVACAVAWVVICGQPRPLMAQPEPGAGTDKPPDKPRQQPAPAPPTPTPTPRPQARNSWVLNDPAAQLEEAGAAFFAQDYAKAIPLLTFLLYPKVRFARKWQMVDARILLGAAHFETGNLVYARREFQEALRRDDEAPMDPSLFAPEVITFFEEIRKEVRAEQAAVAVKLAEARANDRLVEALESMVVIERRPYYVNFVPGGAGQFQNGHNGKGLLFAISEAITCGASVGLWSYMVNRYGIVGSVPNDEVTTVRRLQQFQIGTGAACVVLMGTGIVDSLIHYQSETRVPADESLLPEEVRKKLRRPAKAGKEKKPLSSIHIVPSFGPAGAGMAMSWEF